MPDPGAQRLHPLSPLFAAAKSVRAFVVPAVVVLFASSSTLDPFWTSFGLPEWARGLAVVGWGLFLTVVVAISAVIPYLIFRYTLADDEIVIRDGIFTRTERHIPYSRIQNIDLVQNPLHRAFDVALVRVETASGGKPEAVLRVLSLAAIDQMRARAFAERSEIAAAPTEATSDEEATAGPSSHIPLISPLSTSELVKLGIVSNNGMVVCGAAAGLFYQQQWDFDWEDQAKEYLGTGVEWLDTAAGSPVFGVVAAGIAIVVVGLLLLRLFSIGWYVFKLHGFTLSRIGNDLRAEYGLLTKISRTVPTGRIQALVSTESPLHRVFRRQSVKLQTIGGGMTTEMDLGGQGGGKSESQWLAPMVEPERVPELLRKVDDSIDLPGVVWEPIAHRAWKRVFRRWAVVALIAAVPPTLLASPWASAVIVPFFLGAYFHARLYVKHSAYSLAPWGLLWKSGWFNRTLKLVHYDKIQTVAQRESPFDRRNRMAAVLIDTAGGEMTGHTIAIPYLERAVAEEIAKRLYLESSHRAFHW